MIPYCTIWYHIIQYDTILYNMIPYCTIWYHIVKYDNISYNMILLYDILLYILYYILYIIYYIIHYIFYTILLDIIYYILYYIYIYILLYYILYVLAVTYVERCAATNYHRRLENKAELLTTSKWCLNKQHIIVLLLSGSTQDRSRIDPGSILDRSSI